MLAQHLATWPSHADERNSPLYSGQGAPVLGSANHRTVVKRQELEFQGSRNDLWLLLGLCWWCSGKPLFCQIQKSWTSQLPERVWAQPWVGLSTSCLSLWTLGAQLGIWSCVSSSLAVCPEEMDSQGKAHGKSPLEENLRVVP